MTGYPFVDANMRELKATGFMSNRGRQVVASFLVNDLGLDWRMGAEHFEAFLLDYDPCSNYGNWNYVAGVGTDTTPDRYFSIVRQAQQHDPKCEYILKWIPELKNIPINFLIEMYNLKDDARKIYGIDKSYPKIVKLLKN